MPPRKAAALHACAAVVPQRGTGEQALLWLRGSREGRQQAQHKAQKNGVLAKRSRARACSLAAATRRARSKRMRLPRPCGDARPRLPPRSEISDSPLAPPRWTSAPTASGYHMCMCMCRKLDTTTMLSFCNLQSASTQIKQETERNVSLYFSYLKGRENEFCKVQLHAFHATTHSSRTRTYLETG